MIDCGAVKAVDDTEAMSPKPARAGIEIHTNANPNKIAISVAMKTLRGFKGRREFRPSDRNGRFIYEKQSFPVAKILIANLRLLLKKLAYVSQRVEVYVVKGWRYNPIPLPAPIKSEVSS